MTVTQTVKIPANRRLIIDVPPEIPVGIATLTLAATDTEPVCGKSLIPSKSRASDGDGSFLQFMGCHKGIPGASVDDFLARCREDKELEFAIEERQLEERKRYAKLSP
jgi:hypothetical protein